MLAVGMPRSASAFHSNAYWTVLVAIRNTRPVCPFFVVPEACNPALMRHWASLAAALLASFRSGMYDTQQFYIQRSTLYD